MNNVLLTGLETLFWACWLALGSIYVFYPLSIFLLSLRRNPAEDKGEATPAVSQEESSPATGATSGRSCTAYTASFQALSTVESCAH